jgi:hypothetical protein
MNTLGTKIAVRSEISKSMPAIIAIADAVDEALKEHMGQTPAFTIIAALGLITGRCYTNDSADVFDIVGETAREMGFQARIIMDSRKPG